MFHIFNVDIIPSYVILIIIALTLFSQKPLSLEECPYQYVDNLEQLESLCADLKAHTIFACDLEVRDVIL